MSHLIHYTKFPSDYIKCNITELYNISRKFYILYILINKYRTIEDYSWITISEVFAFYGFKEDRNKPKAFHEIISVLQYMISTNMITVFTDLKKISYSTGIKIKINPDHFDCDNHYAVITSSQVEYIQCAKIPVNKENILLTFLYVVANIKNRSKNQSSEIYPEVFYQSLSTFSSTTGLSKSVISESLSYLCKSNGLLIKHEIHGSSFPNVYLLNKPDYEIELQLLNKKLYLGG